MSSKLADLAPSSASDTAPVLLCFDLVWIPLSIIPNWAFWALNLWAKWRVPVQPCLPRTQPLLTHSDISAMGTNQVSTSWAMAQRAVQILSRISSILITKGSRKYSEDISVGWFDFWGKWPSFQKQRASGVGIYEGKKRNGLGTLTPLCH